MILVKQAGVYVNILNCRLKKHLAEVFKKNGVKLPDWYKEAPQKSAKGKHQDKLRKNQPKEEPVEEAPVAEEAPVEAPVEEAPAEAPAEEAAPAEAPAEETPAEA